MKHITISQQGMSLASVWPLLLSSHLPRMSKSLPTVESLLEHIGSKIWSAFSSCKCTKYQSSLRISIQTLQHFSFDHFYAYISLLCRLRLTQIFCIASFKAVSFWNQQSNHVIILFFTATFKLKVWKGFFSSESTYGWLFIHCCKSSSSPLQFGSVLLHFWHHKLTVKVFCQVLSTVRFTRSHGLTPPS